MNIDKDRVRAAAALDEKTLRELISAVVLATGGSEAKAKAMAAAAPFIRSKLANASDEEIASIVNAVGEERALEILKKASPNG